MKSLPAHDNREADDRNTVIPSRLFFSAPTISLWNRVSRGIGEEFFLILLRAEEVEMPIVVTTEGEKSYGVMTGMR